MSQATRNVDDELKGKRVELVRCTDEWSKLKRGDQGTITFVDDLGTVFVNWDNGERLGLIPGVDSYRVLA